MSDTTTASVSQHPQRRTRKGNAAKATSGLAHQFLMRLAKAGFWLGDLQAVVDEPVLQEFLPQLHSVIRGLRQLAYLRRVIEPRPYPKRENFAEGANRRETPGGSFYPTESKAQQEGDRLYLEAKHLWEENRKKMFRPGDTDIADALQTLSTLITDVSAQLTNAQEEVKEWLASNAKLYSVIRTKPNWDEGDEGDEGPWTDWHSDLGDWHDFCIERLGHGFFSSQQENQLFANLVMTRYWDDIRALSWRLTKNDGSVQGMSVYRKMGDPWHSKLKHRVWELLLDSDSKRLDFQLLLQVWPELVLEQSTEARQAVVDCIAPISDDGSWQMMYRQYLLPVVNASRVMDLTYALSNIQELAKSRRDINIAD